MRVIRPSPILTTPRLLAGALGVETRRWPVSNNAHYDWDRDVFMIYPDERVNLSSAKSRATYERLQRFFGANKAVQRGLIKADGVNVPLTFTDRYTASWYGRTGHYVVRPNRHREGKNYRLTNDPTDFIEGSEYVSEVFPKTHEYRIVFVFGKPLVYLRKKLPSSIEQAAAWSYEAGAYFLTLQYPERSNLFRTDCLVRLLKSKIVQDAHIVGVDILYGEGRWAVTEFNACPSLAVPALSVDRRIKEIVKQIRKHR